jgi:hypothetical protein|tara:strand:+ start:141 stop:854 length:714 start_codon:yes stop_codon:yes gene_type:complete
MINVDRVYQRVLILANKEQRGYITPQEFNLYANQAQMDIFEQYFYDLNQFRRIPGNDTTHADMVDILEEKIGIFEVTAALVLAPNAEGFSSGNLNGLIRFYRLSNVRSDNNIMMESVSRKDFRTFPNSPLTAPTTTRPIYMVDTINNTLQIAGSTLGIANIDYVQSPRDVNWTYVVVGEKALLNATALDYQDFDLHPSEETKLVVKILTLAGLTLKDPNLYQIAAGEDMKNIQQEKQ